ncbi:hypothetical protein O181_097043 [Austropuccinia psidii MF-1]|uniref:Uncharacterized protein n=1 Tax=Austropuccinia psidii MF-1 TaxID=1389203 RepID=A0A9Q3PCS7_9BASI|nr:hypothetical protein [Austropuccinia psidii MF-1]
MPKPLIGGHELLLTHQELSGSGEDNRTLRRVEPNFFQRQGQKEKGLVEELNSFIDTPEEGTGNHSSFGERRPSGIYQNQTSSRRVQRQAQRTSEEAERSQEPSRKGKRKRKLAQTLPKSVKDPQIGDFSHAQCFQYGQNSYGMHSQRAGKDEQAFSTQIKQEIPFVIFSINVELGKIDAKLMNNKNSSELHKSTIAKLELISNTCCGIPVPVWINGQTKQEYFQFSLGFSQYIRVFIFFKRNYKKN